MTAATTILLILAAWLAVDVLILAVVAALRGRR